MTLLQSLEYNRITAITIKVVFSVVLLSLLLRCILADLCSLIVHVSTTEFIPIALFRRYVQSNGCAVSVAGVPVRRRLLRISMLCILL